MLIEKPTFRTEGMYPLYLDTDNPSYKEIAKSILRHSRKIGSALLNRHSDRNLTYLVYHSVPAESKSDFVYPPCKISPELFEIHIKHVASHYNVLSIDEYLDFIANKIALPRRSMIISLDDGYLDNLETAIPILAKYSIPAVIYLATKYIDSAEAQWVDRIYCMFKFRNIQSVSVDFLPKKVWNMADQVEQRTLFSLLNKLFITKTYNERALMLESLSHSFKYTSDIPRLTLNWDEVRQISEKHPNITLGIHTDQHLDMSMHKDELKQELVVSSHKLNCATSKKPEHFSFPYDRVFNGVHTLLSEFGIRSAVCEPTFEVNPEYEQYYIPRIDAVKFPLKQWWYIRN